MKRYRAVSSGLAGLALVLAPLPGRMLWADALKPQTNTVLIDAMDAELHRALSSLGTSGDASQQMKPYFLSYAVSDSDSFTMTAQYGAISATNQSRRRIADVQLRVGLPQQDNTHGDHRNSALTTIPLPLTDDREAIERSLWFATNRGYAKALDSFRTVKTEQQVRAKEEDGSGDFSKEEPKTAILPSSAPLVVEKAA